MNDPGLVFIMWTLVLMVIRYAIGGGWVLFKKRLANKIDEATRIYIETGEETKDFRLLSYNNAEAAKRKRLGLIQHRATTVLSEFEAYQECPRCRTKAHHHIERIPQWTWLYQQEPMPLVRQCVVCQFKWIQK